MTVEQLPPQHGVHVLRVTGELDVLTAQPLHERVTALAHGRPLVLDLTDLTFVDSSGVRAVNRLARTQVASGGLRVVAPRGGRARRVLDIVGFGAGLVVDDLEQALVELRG